MNGLRCTVWLLACVLLPLTAAAQTGASIAGAATDESNLVLPGVTVEAASPALIEGSRTAVTDGAGNYTITELRPGTYTVTFTLPGFSTVVREGLELTTGFTANVSVQMQVGGVEETITVTGATPVVDIQNTRNQLVIDDEVLLAAPTGVGDSFAYAAMTVGMKTTKPDASGSQQGVGGGMEYHGISQTDSRFYLDGMDYNSYHGTGGGSDKIYEPNMAVVEEANLSLSTGSAEHQTAGVAQNLVPKEGGNQFSVSGNLVYANDSMQHDNLTDELRGRGLEDAGGVIRSWNRSLVVGGPIRRDRLWFFGGPRFSGSQNNNFGAFRNKTQGTPFYTPDLDKPADADIYVNDFTGRLTWQADDRNKVAYLYSRQTACLCTFVATPTLAPEFWVNYEFDHHLHHGTWTFPVTNELLFQAGVSYDFSGLSSTPQDNVGPNDISIIDAGTGQLYGSVAAISFSSSVPYGDGTKNDPLTTRFSVSYVTGSHNVKVGIQTNDGFIEKNGHINRDLQYIFYNQFPILINQFATPLASNVRIRNFGLYAQDQWTIGQLTLNYGVRFDQFKGWVKEITVPAGSFVPERSFAAVNEIPSYKDVTPRLGVAYDVFGDGRTAIKAAFGTYVASMGAGLTQLINPAQLQVNQTSRSWFDANSDYEPDCDLTNFGANGECGPINNSLFGQPVPGLSFADDVIKGWGNRSQNWQTSVSLQQEVAPGWSATAAWHRTEYKNFFARINTAVTAADFDTFCVPAPMDSRLPNGGGYDICGVVDVKPDKFGQVFTEIQKADGIGDVSQVYNGFEVTVNGRFGQGGVLYGGINVGRTRTNDCAFNDTPQATPSGLSSNPVATDVHPLSEPYCDVARPWSKAVELKVNGVYPLPYGVVVSGVLQSLPGIPQTAIRSYSNAEVSPFLGRDLAAGPTTRINIPVLPPETSFEPRLTMLDVRLSKSFEFGDWRVRGMLDVYNLFNGSFVTAIINTYGARWLHVGSRGLEFGRRFKVGAQVDF